MEFCYRRKLPHWRQDQVTYFVTWRLAQGREELDASERELVVAAIKSFYGQRYQLAGYVVMDDHVRFSRRWPGTSSKRFCIPGSRSPPVRCSASISALGASGRTSPSTGSFAMMKSSPRSLITLSEIPGSAGLRSGTTPGSGLWTDERCKGGASKRRSHIFPFVAAWLLRAG